MDSGRWLARARVPLGWILGLAALVLSRPTPATYWAGIVLATAGEALRLWAAGHLEKDAALTRSGPYARTRNPLYFGSLLVGGGFALATGRIALVLALGALFGAVYVPVMKREAERLARAFPAAYEEYAARVPLFLPRLSRIPPGGKRFRWDRVRRNREHVTVLGVVAVAVFLGWRLAG